MNFVSIAAWKVGMTQVKQGDEVIAATLLQIKPHEVLRVKTKKTDGYNAICFSAGNLKKQVRVSKPQLKELEKNSTSAREKIFEVRLNSDVESFSLSNDKIADDFFDALVGLTVDIKGKSTGKGFAGVMKRWNFRGLEASHGVSITHRSHGSTGQRQDPGKVFKGKKMAGRLGGKMITVQNLKILFVDKELGLIGVKGAVPGVDTGIVYVSTAVKGRSMAAFQSINSLKII